MIPGSRRSGHNRPMALVAIGLGSNRGDRPAMLRSAIEALASEIEVVAVSPYYETDPMYVLDQPDYLNAAIVARTELGPLALLKLLKATEQMVGRVPAERNGPREIDLDLLAYGCLSYRFEVKGRTVLQVPHPRTPERRFVLKPLSDIAPDLVLVGLGRVSGLLAATEGQAASVREFNNAAFSLSGA